MLVLVILGGGCGPQLQAVPAAEQVVLPLDGGAVRVTPTLAAEARPVDVPWPAVEPLVAFDLKVQNVSDVTYRWDPADLTLQDGSGRFRRPLPVAALVQSYRAATGNGPLPPGLQPDANRNRRLWRPWRGTALDWKYRYLPYDYPSPYRGSPYPAYHALTVQGTMDPDPLWDRRRSASFLLQVPGAFDLAPGDTLTGCIVFSCPLELGAELVLSLPVPETADSAEASVPMQMRFVYQ
jgi:hypothetical protein